MNKSVKSIMPYTSRIVIIVLVFISFITRTNATHIVGGSVSYKCLGNSQYEISVTIRRDCFNGDPEAFFDDPASVGVFDANGALVRAVGVSGQLLMSLKLNDTLDEIREEVCALDGTKSFCIHETTYKGVVTLPFRAGGYIIEYQRCCRNVPIQNIKDPLETGASWIVQISEDALKSCNSSPRFKKWSPVFICAGKPFNFDHSAIDDDGDSLVYKVWTPFVGATRTFPKPQPPNAPDFKEVVWQAPYSEANMLGGDPFRIDSKTGALFAVPSSLGQYLLGVKVEEYRNGKLLSTVYRDYEVKIIDCTNLVDAKIVAPSLQCDNLAVNFKQQSENPKFVRWYFDYGRNPNATSTLQEPTYKYADTGTYKVALIITRDSSCFDTAFQVIRLKLSSTTIAQFVTKAGDCVNGVLKISMTDLSTGVEPGSKYNWTFNFNGQTLTSNEKNPSFNVPNGVRATVKLDITQDGVGCSSNVSKTFTTSFVQPEFHKDQQVICAGDTTTIKFILQDSIKGKYNYLWDQSPFIIGSRNTPEPIVSVPNIGSNYIYVTVDNKNGCTSRDSILLISKAKPKLDFRVENALGSLDAKFVNLSDQLTNYQWDFGVANINSDTSSLRDPSYKFPAKGMYVITLSTKEGCAPSISKKVNIGGAGENLIDTIFACNGQKIGINPKADSQYTYKWTPSGKLDDPTAVNPKFVVDSQRTFISQLNDRSTGVEAGKHTVVVIPVINPNAHIDNLVVCKGDTIKIPYIQDPAVAGKYTYEWEPNPAIVSGSNTASPSIFTNATSPFYLYVKINNGAGCIARDSVLIDPRNKPRLDFKVDNANGSLLAKFINLSDQLNNYHWDFGVPGTTADTSSLRDPSYTYPAKGMYMITLSTTDGCAPSVTKKITIGGDAISITDTINACIGKTVALNPKANAIYTYKWTPGGKVSDPNIANPTFIVDTARTFVAQLFDANTGVAVGIQTVVVRTPITDQVNNLPDSIMACAGQPVALNPKGDAKLKYEWTPANLLDNPTSPNPSATVTSNTVFNVKITNPKDSCTLTDKLVVVIPSRIALDAIPDSLDACNGVSVNLNPNGKADPNLKYKWSPGKVLDDSTKFNPAATITKPTLFTVTISDIRFANCSVTKTVKVNIPVINEANKVKDSIMTCAGIPISLNPTGDPRFKYEWTPASGLDNPNLANPTATVNQTTVFSVKVTDNQRGNCVQSRQTKVIVPPAFDVTPAFKDTTSCTVTAFKLKATSKNPKVTFEWFDPSGNKIGLKDTITVSPAQKTKYVVTGTDENGCKKSDTVAVDPAKINLDAQVIGPSLLCQGDSLRLQAVGSNPGQVLTYQWSPANAILSGANTASPTVKPTSTTTFVVNVSNKQGCTAVDSVTVTVSPIGTINSAANPTTIIIGASSQITSTILPGYTYKWSPVDGLDNPNIANPVAKPKKTTTYTLSATSPDGCIRSLNVTITVTVPECAEPFIFLPNAFSPNGDGKNDVLYLRSNIADRMTLIIYDRWGEKVFETSNQSVGWDGTFRGKLLDPDVYAYYLSVTCIDGQTFMKKGNVTIIK